MKELSIEEKARAYDRASKEVKDFFEGRQKMYSDVKQTLEYLFPELKESEDEKIRKECISIIDAWDKLCRSQGDYCEVAPKCIAWLEKQGKESVVTDVLIKAGLKPYKDGNKWCILVGDNIQEGICGFGDTIDEALFEFLKELVENQGEQKSEEFPNGEDYGIDSLYHAERILEKTLGEVEGYQSDDGILEHKCAIEAVKHLYKQKPAWSEDDNELIDSVIELIDSGALDRGEKDYFIENLKSLKERYTWKPNDEQMKQLGWVAKQNKDNMIGKELMSLYQDLKKLKDE